MTRAFEIVLGYGTLIVALWSFFDATRFSKTQYKDVGKMPRLAWLLALGAAIVLQIWLGGFRTSEPFSARSLTWAAIVMLLVVWYFDQRPKLQRSRYAGVS